MRHRNLLRLSLCIGAVVFCDFASADAGMSTLEQSKSQPSQWSQSNATSPKSISSCIESKQKDCPGFKTVDSDTTSAGASNTTKPSNAAIIAVGKAVLKSIK